MKIKLDEHGNVVLKDGMPIYVHDDGKELAFDAAGTVATISRLNGEAKGHRERAQAAEAALKAFEGISDPALALKALETLKNLDDKKLVDAGQVDHVKAEAKAAYEEKLRSVEEKYKPILAERDKLQHDLITEKVGGSFSRSKFIAEKLNIPPDMVQSRFGGSFKLEEDRVVAYDSQGNKLFSRAKPGEVAPFDEALEMIVDSYPYKDNILKGSGATGGGATGGGKHGGNTMSRAHFGTLSPAEQMTAVKSGVSVVE